MDSAGVALRGPDWAAALRARLKSPPAEPALWMERNTQLLKSDRHSKVGMIKIRDQLCFLKLYLAKSRLQQLGFRLGYGRPIRSFDAASRLAAEGLPVPVPRACLLVPGGMFLLTEGLQDSRDLRALWMTGPTAQEARQYMQTAGEVLANMHHKGFAHGDCKWSNLLWFAGSLYFVDLEAVRAVSSKRNGTFLPHTEQMQDIARFTADAEAMSTTTQQYEVFLQHYCARGTCPREQLLKGVLPRLEVIRARHRKKYSVSHQTLV